MFVKRLLKLNERDHTLRDIKVAQALLLSPPVDSDKFVRFVVIHVGRLQLVDEDRDVEVETQVVRLFLVLIGHLKGLQHRLTHESQSEHQVGGSVQKFLREVLDEAQLLNHGQIADF